jgi:hypothetical protein
MRRALLIGAALLLALPAGALAQAAPRIDPEVGSPAESVYGIPLEEARRDGAPAAVAEPAIRSENGVGSSSVVPGTGRDADADDPRRRRDGRAIPTIDPELASNRLSGEPAPGPTILLLALVLAVAIGGGVIAGRRSG